MKTFFALLISLVLSTGLISQTIEFDKYYIKTETGGKPELVDDLTRSISFNEHTIEVTNLFGCEYTRELRIVEKLGEYKYIIAYEGREIALVYSPEEKILVVTSGEGVKGERTLYMYAEK